NLIGGRRAMRVQRFAMGALAVLGSALPVAVPFAVGQEHEPAQEAVSRMVEIGRKLLKAGAIEEALEKFEEARSASSDQAAEAFTGLAEAELQLDDLERALQHVDKALELEHSPVSRAQILNLKGSIFGAHAWRSLPMAAAATAELPKTEGGSKK